MMHWISPNSRFRPRPSVLCSLHEKVVYGSSQGPELTSYQIRMLHDWVTSKQWVNCSHLRWKLFPWFKASHWCLHNSDLYAPLYKCHECTFKALWKLSEKLRPQRVPRYRYLNITELGNCDNCNNKILFDSDRSSVSLIHISNMSSIPPSETAPSVSTKPASMDASPKSRAALIPWDPDSPEHHARLQLQRKACGWKYDKSWTEKWARLQKEGKIALQWVVCQFPRSPSSFRERNTKASTDTHRRRPS